MKKTLYEAVTNYRIELQSSKEIHQHQSLSSHLLTKKAPASVSISQYDIIITNTKNEANQIDAFQLLKRKLPPIADASIHELNLSHNHLDDTHLVPVLELLKRGAQKINLSSNYFTKSAMKQIIKAIGEKKVAQEVNLSNQIGLLYSSTPSEDISRTLLEIFDHLSYLSSLSLSLSSSFDILYQKIRSHSAIRKLSLPFSSQINLSAIQQILLLDKLTHLSLSGCLIGHRFSPLCSIFPSLTSLQSLDLSKNALGNITGRSICLALRDNISLRSLNLSYNHLGDIFCESLADLLLTNDTLESVDLTTNPIDNKGAKYILQSLRILRRPKVFYLGDLEESWPQVDFQVKLDIYQKLCQCESFAQPGPHHLFASLEQKNIHIANANKYMDAQYWVFN